MVKHYLCPWLPVIHTVCMYVIEECEIIMKKLQSISFLMRQNNQTSGGDNVDEYLYRDVNYKFREQKSTHMTTFPLHGDNHL